jgi:hypothetical protein
MHQGPVPIWSFVHVCKQERKAVFRYFTIAITALALCHSARAQSATGAIQGRVTDRTGGAVP